MRLYPVDDYPFHQHPAPFATVATTDPAFNDGYWFAFYAADWYLLAGLRLHPNVNAIDGFSAVAHDDRQHCVRFSRALRPRYGDLDVGPLHVEIIEPMQRLRLVLDENPAGITFDVVLAAQAPPFVEERYQHRKHGVVVNDTLRYTQICRATGTAALAEQRLAVDSWHAMRDHSWGRRTSMGTPVRVGGVDRAPDEADDRAIRLWVPFQVDDHTGFFHTHEDRSGTTLDLEGRLDFPDGRSVEVVEVRHALRYLDGTPRPVGGSFELVCADGETRAYELAASGTPADVQGIGYYRGWHDGKGPGVYRGAEHLEHDVYDTHPDGGTTGPPHVPVERRLGPTEYPCFLTGPGGVKGMAHLEHHIFGAYEPYGFA